MKILILDDDAALLDAVENILAHHGHSVDKTSHAPRAVDMVQDNGYDIVLADYSMPGENGAWFLQNASLPRGTKVILITAHANKDVINRMFKLGASGYMIKPFGEEDLLHHLEFHGPKESAG